ncbi:MAG: myo-inositol-1(or 4)-monophosphatase [Gammaproteobacteria bacterium]|nr:MAG: myo-inositol-1(or 4)-monophosphatase [Gammaproteobacteria bacterium]TND03227.1 MAG: myo-inositol-1(or 4)-monophosphatase [Gammaproteobacteria bacterium]
MLGAVFGNHSARGWIFVMHPIVNIAVRAARRAGDIIMRSADRIDTVSVVTKGKNDFASDVDKRAEAEIIKIIRKAYPGHGILAEESGGDSSADTLWIIDPLDGTTNYLHGLPHYAVSIAMQHRGKLEHAVVYDPVRQELFTASRGAGAQLNERRIRVAPAKDLSGTLLGTGFPFRSEQHIDAYLGMFKALFQHAADIRRPGSAALDLAYVAAGRLDGFWEIGLSKWDIAGGALLVREAGGLVGDFAGGENFMESGNLVAANPRVFKEILRTIRPHLTPDLQK